MKELTFRDVSMSYDAVQALDAVSLRLPAGQITSLVGPNGAGKSTLLGVASGQLRPTGGEVQVDGRTLTYGRPHRVAAAGIRRSFQTPRMLPARTVLENVVVGCADRRAHLLEELLGTRRQRTAEKDMWEAASRALAVVGLDSHADRPAGSLSYGQVRLMEIARAVAGRPELLLLDEPAAGLNTRETDRLGDLLLALVRDHGMGVVLVEHNLGLVQRLSEQIYVLNFGRLIAGGPPDQVTRDPAVVAAYTGGVT